MKKLRQRHTHTRRRTRPGFHALQAHRSLRAHPGVHLAVDDVQVGRELPHQLLLRRRLTICLRAGPSSSTSRRLGAFRLGVKRIHRNPDRSGSAEDPFESSKIRGSADPKKKKICQPRPAGMHDVPRPGQLRAWTKALRDRLRPSACNMLFAIDSLAL